MCLRKVSINPQVPEIGILILGNITMILKLIIRLFSFLNNIQGTFKLCSQTKTGKSGEALERRYRSKLETVKCYFA